MPRHQSSSSAGMHPGVAAKAPHSAGDEKAAHQTHFRPSRRHVPVGARRPGVLRRPAGDRQRASGSLGLSSGARPSPLAGVPRSADPVPAGVAPTRKTEHIAAEYCLRRTYSLRLAPRLWRDEDPELKDLATPRDSGLRSGSQYPDMCRLRAWKGPRPVWCLASPNTTPTGI